MSGRVLILPGYNDSDPQHWQSLWEKKHREFIRVEQADWDNPDCDTWVSALDDAVRADDSEVCLVAHSLGCITAAHWATLRYSPQVIAALLVAPADVEEPPFRSIVESFCPAPLQRLPFRSVMVASSNDPYLSLDRARQFARAWGSELVEVGAQGHINTDAGFGEWPEGEMFLGQLLRGMFLHV